MQSLETVNLSIEGMSCGGCVRHVTHALNAVPGVRVEDVKVGSARVTIIDPERTSAETLVTAVQAAGYAAKSSAAAGQPA